MQQGRVIPYRLPDIGEGILEAGVFSCPDVGAEFREDEDFFEVETDKGAVTLSCPMDCEVVEVLVEEGDMVSVGSVMCRVAVSQPNSERLAPSRTLLKRSSEPGDMELSRRIAKSLGLATSVPDAPQRGPQRDPEARRYVFVSHSHQDSGFADGVAKRMRARGIECYVADGAIQAGEPIRDAVEKALRASTHHLVIVSEFTAGSTWVAYELGFSRARGIPIVPYIAEPRYAHDPEAVLPKHLSGALCVNRDDEAGFLDELARGRVRSS